MGDLGWNFQVSTFLLFVLKISMKIDKKHPMHFVIKLKMIFINYAVLYRDGDANVQQRQQKKHVPTERMEF